jgi:hypothetical protein
VLDPSFDGDHLIDRDAGAYVLGHGLLGTLPVSQAATVVP